MLSDIGTEISEFTQIPVTKELQNNSFEQKNLILAQNESFFQ